MLRKQGYEALHFELIADNKFDAYVSGVQLSAANNYTKMEEIIRFIFPG